MKSMSKKLMSIATTVVVSVSILSGFSNVKAAVIDKETVSEKSTTAETRGKYATNPNGFGKEKTITIDGDVSDWSDDMLIAQGAAWDIANNWKGGHENCVLDSYALYAAWDNENLYIGWQMVNTTDTWANSGDGPLSDGGRVLDVPLVIALNVGNKTAMNGKMANGKLIWDALQVEYETRVDHLFLMSGKPGLGTPAMFTAADASGGASYDAEYCQSFKETGIQYKMAETSIPTQIWGLAGSDSPDDVYSDSANWVDMMTKGHDRKYDSFYEMSIPLSVLGIDKSYITSNGIGVMQISTRGVSAIDCLPHDPSMLDNATGECAVDPATSHEKDDTDVITVPLAQIGNGGGVTPPPVSKGTLKVKYVDEAGNEIATSKTLTGDVGSSYTTSAETISGYTLKETPSNATGKYTTSTITVTYVYSENGITPPPIEEGTVILKYVDEAGNEIASQTTKTGEVGTSYTTTAKTISGYTLVSTPANATGTYKNGNIIVTYYYSKEATKELNITSFKANVASPQNIGTEVILSALADGDGQLKYRFRVKDQNGNTTTIRDYAISNIAIWNANKVGNNTLYVDVKDENGNVKTKSITYTIKSNLEITSFTANKTSPQAVKTAVIFTTKASGAAGIAQYKYYRYLNGNYATIKDWSTSSSIAIAPSTVGKYDIYVAVKDSSGNTVRKNLVFEFKNQANLAISSFTASKTSPQAVKTEVTFTTKVSGVTGTVQYKYYRYLNGNYATIKDWSTSSSIAIAPSTVGKYDIYVAVKDSSGNTVRKNLVFEFKNQANLAISSFTANKTSPQAVKTAVTFTTKVSGVTGTAQYKYYRYLNGNYATIKDWSTSSSIAIAPSTAGKYDVYVAVKDSSGNTVRKNVVFEFKNQANLAISSFTASKTSPQAVKTAVTLTTKVSGVTGTAQYKYYRYLNGNYATIKDWSTSSSITIAPSTAGTYDLWVAVKDGSGKTVKKNLTFQFNN